MLKHIEDKVHDFHVTVRKKLSLVKTIFSMIIENILPFEVKKEKSLVPSLSYVYP